MAFLTAVLALLTLAANPGTGFSTQPPDEYQVKAAFLFNFAKFVDWPPAILGSPDMPFTICVRADHAFRETLVNTVAGKTVGGRAIEVVVFSEAGQIGNCRMLFVGSRVDKTTLSILCAAGLTSRGVLPAVLTVGDGEGAAVDAMIIRFLMENGKVRFEIDPGAAERAGLHISAKLLSLAQVRRK